ncbi:MAG TPA: TatD family hydrolase [Longimicrobium sp.]|jgi:TatD DNase family protein
MRLIDSHAHLADERILPDVDAVVERARAAGLAGVVTIATDAEDARTNLDLAERFGDVWSTAGIHPHVASTSSDQTLAAVRELAAHPRVVALGETGLDYHYDFSPRPAQRTNFARHLELARETGLPVIVHSRESDGDLRALLREAGQGTVGVLHSFSSGRELLEEALAMGWYASFSGMITFKKFESLDFVRLVPADRIMVETDTPYLAPVPHRGKTNEPAFVTHVARRAAEIRGEDADAFAAQTLENTRRFYRKIN